MKNYDTRDLEDELQELESEFQNWFGQLTESEKEEIASEQKISMEYMEESNFRDEWIFATESGERYKNIQDLKEEIGRPWKDGVHLIHENNFTEYAEQLARDSGLTSSLFQDWPYCYIDWSAAADELMMDYSDVVFDGETYYYRE